MQNCSINPIRWRTLVEETASDLETDVIITEYQAILTGEETEAFCSDFYALEAGKFTKVEIDATAGRNNVVVTLSIDNVFADLLNASFEDGLLSTWGWSERFTKK